MVTHEPTDRKAILRIVLVMQFGCLIVRQTKTDEVGLIFSDISVHHRLECVRN